MASDNLFSELFFKYSRYPANPESPKATIPDSHHTPFMVESTHADYGRILVNGTGGDAQISFASSDSTKWSIGNDDTDHSFVMRTGFGAFGTNDKLSLDTSGNLEIAGNISGSASSTGSFGQISIPSGSHAGKTLTTVTSTGRVGIGGVTSPSSRLHVVGDPYGVSSAPIQAQNNTYGNKSNGSLLVKL